MVVQHHVQVCRFLLRAFEERGGEFNRMLHCDAIGHIQSDTGPCSSIIIHLILTNVDPTSSFWYLHDPWRSDTDWMQKEWSFPNLQLGFPKCLGLSFQLGYVTDRGGSTSLLWNDCKHAPFDISLPNTHGFKNVSMKASAGMGGSDLSEVTTCDLYDHWSVHLTDDPKKSRLKKADIQLMVD